MVVVERLKPCRPVSFLSPIFAAFAFIIKDGTPSFPTEVTALTGMFAVLSLGYWNTDRQQPPTKFFAPLHSHHLLLLPPVHCVSKQSPIVLILLATMRHTEGSNSKL